ncbi:synaptobrevin-1 isoform X2 [Phlebotomus papatasi]|uniref:synaptobrevin-1 isoform X2 n=1 Tax=Phlebotomus papatasi TaxID=29031 RepID=UPI0024833829|nr:synaptobrevin-1 isoform X2 [Phlebotomus papatasi]
MASQDGAASGSSGTNNNSAAPGGGGGQANAGNKRLQQTQAQVDEVVGIMRVNVEKVLERDQKLSELDQRADALQHGASQFEQQAGKLKRKHWWANIKMMIIMGVIGVVLLIIIIVSLLPSSSNTNANAPIDSAPNNAGN